MLFALFFRVSRGFFLQKFYMVLESVVGRLHAYAPQALVFMP